MYGLRTTEIVIDAIQMNLSTVLILIITRKLFSNRLLCNSNGKCVCSFCFNFLLAKKVIINRNTAKNVKNTLLFLK